VDQPEYENKVKIRRAVLFFNLYATAYKPKVIRTMCDISSKGSIRLDIQLLYPYMQSQENLGEWPSQTLLLLALGFGFGAGKATTSSSDGKTFSPKIIF
jgi:hypothetical protein